MARASTSCPTWGLSNIDFPVSYPQRITKKISSSHPFSRIILPPKSCASATNRKGARLSITSCLIDGSVAEPKETSTQIKVETSDHWRKNIPILSESHRVFAIDLIGYGYSDKPSPREFGDHPFYTFDTWGNQLNDFVREVVKDKAFYICNSIGGVVGLQAAVNDPNICKGIVLLNISLRLLHITKQPWYGRPFIRSFQNLLRNTPVGKLFFKTIATRESVRNVLCQCYHDTSQVTDELVEAILLPGLERGAVDVFLEFICYSGGPLPEELLPQVKCPVLLVWGDKDPWEPIELGRAFANFDTVENFVALPDVGHCPQDEAPHLVNPLVESFVARHATAKS